MSIEIPNPIRWYYNCDEDAEWWHGGGNTRESAIDAGAAAYDGGPFWIAKAKSMVPRFDIFDGDDICERINDDAEAWGEDGWTGDPDDKAKRELEDRLTETLKAWFVEFASLSGSNLDEISSEHITAQAIEARRVETGTGSVADERAVGNADAPETPDTKDNPNGR